MFCNVLYCRVCNLLYKSPGKQLSVNDGERTIIEERNGCGQCSAHPQRVLHASEHLVGAGESLGALAPTRCSPAGHARGEALAPERCAVVGRPYQTISDKERTAFPEESTGS